jgi:hypothetical protein
VVHKELMMVNEIQEKIKELADVVKDSDIQNKIAELADVVKKSNIQGKVEELATNPSEIQEKIKELADVVKSPCTALLTVTGVDGFLFVMGILCIVGFFYPVIVLWNQTRTCADCILAALVSACFVVAGIIGVVAHHHYSIKRLQFIQEWTSSLIQVRLREDALKKVTGDVKRELKSVQSDTHSIKDTFCKDLQNARNDLTKAIDKACGDLKTELTTLGEQRELKEAQLEKDMSELTTRIAQLESLGCRGFSGSKVPNEP